MTRNDEIRKTIIDTTKNLIMQKPSITIREIADKCFVNVAAVNYYFGSKEQLLGIVLEETIKEIKDSVTNRIKEIDPTAPVESIFEAMVDFIYSYATENSGLLEYLILNVENRSLTTKMFVEAFFMESEFKEMVFENLKEATGLEDEQAINARYILIFSCFVLPLLIHLLQDPLQGPKLADLKDEKFKKQYIQQLVRMVH